MVFVFIMIMILLPGLGHFIFGMKVVWTLVEHKIRLIIVGPILLLLLGLGPAMNSSKLIILLCAHITA